MTLSRTRRDIDWTRPETVPTQGYGRRVPASAVEQADLDWVIELLNQRRAPLVEFASVFWRPAADASASHRAFIQYLLTEGGAKGFRTGHAVVIAAPRGEGWLVDDMHVSGSDWVHGDGRALWNALDGVAHGAQVRFVCPTYEADRGEFAQAVGLSVIESWWLLEFLNGPTDGEAGVRVDLAGAEGITVAAPPVYDPGGPVLNIPALSGNAPTVLAAAIATAPELGCPAIVVNQVAGDAALEQALVGAGLRRHCDYYSGTIRSV